MRLLSLLLPARGVDAGSRAEDRYRRVLLSAAASGAAAFAQLLSTVVIVRVTVNYLGAERYGLWMALTSAIALLGFADLGIGNGLMAALARAHGKEGDDEEVGAVSSAFAVLSTLALLVIIGLAFGYRFVSWAHFFNVRSPLATQEAAPTATVLIACLAVNLPLSVVQKIRLGYQEAYANSLWAGFASLLAALGVYVATKTNVSLQGLVLCVAGAPVVASAAHWLSFLRGPRGWLRPSVRAVSMRVAAKLLRVGVLFLILQLAAAIAYQVPMIVLGNLLGASAVPVYSIPMRLFLIVPMLVGFILTPLWPAYGEAHARGDNDWILRAFRRSLRLSLFVNLPAASGLALFGPAIVSFWVGPSVQPPHSLFVAMAVWAVLSSVGGPLAALLNGLTIVWFQACCAILMALSCIVLCSLWVSNSGVTGAMYGVVVSQLVFVFLPASIYVPRQLKRLRLTCPQAVGSHCA